MECLVCGKHTYVRLLECCQLETESRYKICSKCVYKLEMCPLCRSPKVIPVRDLKRIIIEWEQMHWSHVNCYFAVYKYLSDNLFIPSCKLYPGLFNFEFFMNDLTLLEMGELSPLDILPDCYNISQINV